MPGCDPAQPDLLFVQREHTAIIRDGRIHGVPDRIIDVRLPGNAADNERVKAPAYALAGVPEYALVRPMTRSVSAYRLDDQLGWYAGAA
jgi:Uma2 family endonuclease